MFAAGYTKLCQEHVDRCVWDLVDTSRLPDQLKLVTAVKERTGSNGGKAGTEREEGWGKRVPLEAYNWGGTSDSSHGSRPSLLL